jgi:hypothetical protein
LIPTKSLVEDLSKDSSRYLCHYHKWQEPKITISEPEKTSISEKSNTDLISFPPNPKLISKIENRIHFCISDLASEIIFRPVGTEEITPIE